MCRRILLLALITVLPTCTVFASPNDYSRLARISYLDGTASFMHPNDVEWTAASINMPLQIADRIYTGADGRAEIEFDDGSVIRLAERTDIEILSLTEELIQVRVLTGLASLDLRSGIAFEISTPAAAFTALRKGSYRFDVAENGDADGIVRRGLLEATNNKLSRQIESEQVIHVVASDPATYVVSKYQARDAWDEWVDRRNADMAIRARGSYVPAEVSMGVSDLDRYGRWVTLEQYGPVWIPSYVDTSWSPYWSGRWCYRPNWGWTWISYEPWGWLPYHYGRWHHHASFGWCWLPGAAFEFNFWSPGLVRFYHGPNWVSWAPLGPGDYYNVHNYHYNNIYTHQLNQLRMMQNRSSENLHNQNIPGAFRTVRTEQFLQNSFGPSSRTAALTDIDQPWIRGRMINDRLPVTPNARSYAPAPEQPAVRPQQAGDRLPTFVRSQPAAQDLGARFIRANPALNTGRTTQNEALPAYTGRRVPEVATPGRGLSRPAEALQGPSSGIERNPVRTFSGGTEREFSTSVASPRGGTEGIRREVPAFGRPERSTTPAQGMQPGRQSGVPVPPAANRPETSTPVYRQPQAPAVAPRPESKPAQARPRIADPPETVSLGTQPAGQEIRPSPSRPLTTGTEQGWSRSVPTFSRYETTPTQNPTSRYQVQEQPTYNRGYAGQAQPSYSWRGSSSTSTEIVSPQVDRSNSRLSYPQSGIPSFGSPPKAASQESYAGRQYSSPGPDRGSYSSAGRAFPAQSPAWVFSSPSGGGASGGGRNEGAMGGAGSSRSGGGNVSGGRRK